MAMLDHLTTFIFEDITLYLGAPDVKIGDGRDDHHKGMMTNDSRYIALFHLTEHGLFDHLTYNQSLAMIKFLAMEIGSIQDKCNAKKGAHHGISANITLQIVARAYHCKYPWDFTYLTTSSGNVLWARQSGNRKQYFVVTHDNIVMTYNHFKAIQ